ncbi:MAG: ATP-dependent DNA helicase RecG [Tissierellia bacterium]|nr:ATP-dependent DNA helicase RecG [Tissierellia bacterium]
MMDLLDPITQLKGLGPKKADRFKNLGVSSIFDLICLKPHRYEDTSREGRLLEAPENEKMTFHVQVTGKSPSFYGRGPKRSQFTIEDASGSGELVFFNQPYLAKKISLGQDYYLYGALSFFQGKRQLVNPVIERGNARKNIGKILPVYPQVEGLKTREISRFVGQALDQLGPVEEFIPAYLLERYGLMSFSKAVREIHQPQTRSRLDRALNRLIFEEFFLFQLSLLEAGKRDSQSGYSFKDQGLIPLFLESLPFDLTPGQGKVWEEIAQDLGSGKVMSRLIQGDVGSGKTVLAFLASLRAIENGYQVLFMAPTEILAKQHYQAIQEMLEPLGVRGELILGQMTKKRRQEVTEAVEMGACHILVGTHALIYSDLDLKKLGLTIIDEQHRFGVKQREALRKKNPKAHGLIMSATPIPRTLEMVYYGDLDISRVEGLPQGRKPVKTMAINRGLLNRAFSFIGDQLAAGNQMYVICPLIEESSKSDLEAAEAIYQHLAQEVYPQYGVGLLHGKMPAQDKDQIMARFVKGDLQILVSTTVIEVGVNVPKANLLLVYNAERFGLSQLHQLRGRVGRGQSQAYCLLYSDLASDKAVDRLRIMEASNDGFYIAQKDLELRGGGDLFGTRQSGLASFKFGDPLENGDIMHYAHLEAKAIIKGDHLNQRELPDLLRAVRAYSSRRLEPEA